MANESLYPLLLNPALHVKVWGGRKLETVMHKPLATDEPYGESWELHDTSTVANGALVGKSLGELLPIYGAQLVGARNNPAEGFPLLVKLIDASEWLSVQVHPNDEQAKMLEGQPRGKTEAWVILASDEGAQLVVGVQPGTTPRQMMDAIRQNRLESLLVYAQVKAGDVLFIPAGTIHAIGGGILLYEIQQSSDTTYRLYDWGRMGLDGKPRELHIEKSVQVSNITAPAPVEHPTGQTLIHSPYFTTLLYKMNGDTVSGDTGGDTFHALTCIVGSVTVTAGESRVEMGIGQTVLIPAALGVYQLSGSGQALCSFQTS